MTTTELIALLKKYEFGGATGKPREISFQYRGTFIPEPKIEVDSTGDGMFAEICLSLESEESDRTLGDTFRSMNDKELAELFRHYACPPLVGGRSLCEYGCLACWFENLGSTPGGTLE